MIRYNRFLQTSQRSDLIGRNLSSSGISDFRKVRCEQVSFREGHSVLWDDPAPGMSGVLALGHQVEVTDALTVSFTADGRPVTLRPTRNQWTPAWMDTVYHSLPDSSYYPHSGTLVVREKKAISPSDVYVGHLTITNQKREPSQIRVQIAMPFPAADTTLLPAADAAVLPASAKGDLYRVETQTVPGALFAHYPVTGYAAVATDQGSSTMDFTLAPYASVQIRYAMAFDPKDASSALQKAGTILWVNDPFKTTEQTFDRWFTENVPALETEDEDLLKVYYYRWFLVYRSIHRPSDWIADHPIPGNCVYESPFGRWFGSVVGLPIPWHISELRWMRSPALGQEQLAHWGQYPTYHQGYIQFTPWCAWQFYLIHGDKDWLQTVYEGLAGFARKILTKEFPAPTLGSWVTGAEYQPSFYQHAPTAWDWRYDVEGKASGFYLRTLYRADAISYDILSLRGCASMAKELGMTEDQNTFTEAAEKLAAFVKETMWDPDSQFFCDVDYESGARCDQAPGYDGFAPFIDQIAGSAYRQAFRRLQDPDWFLTYFTAPSVAKHCPMFWFDNCITGPTRSSTREPHEYGCCWNGPVWPYANSIISMGLGCAARRDLSLQKQWLTFFANYTELHFLYGDRSTPVICEHYRSDDGTTFSPHSDYFHSSWIDQFMRFYAGIEVTKDSVSFMPYTTEPFTLSGVRIHGKTYRFTLHANGCTDVIQE